MAEASALGGALPVTPFDFLAIFAAAWLAARLYKVLSRRLERPKPKAQ